MIERLENQQSIDITKEYIEGTEKALKDIFFKGFQNSLLNTFSSLKNLTNKISNKNFEIKLIFYIHDHLKIYLNQEDKITIEYHSILNKMEYKGENEEFYLIRDGQIKLNEFSHDNLAEGFIEYAFLNVYGMVKSMNHAIKDVCYLPTIRFGIYLGLNSLTPIIVQLMQS